MANVKILLYKSKSFKDGRHPVVLRVTHERNRKYITLGEGNRGYSCLPDQWNDQTSRFKREFTDYKTLNQILLDTEQKANKIIHRLALDNEEFTFEKFERLIGWAKSKDDLNTIFTEEIDRLRKAGRISYANVFESTKEAIQKFAPRKDLRLRDINYKFLSDFESHSLGKGNMKNTISVYMRTFRTLFNTAIKCGYIKEEHYPFLSRSNPNGYSLRNLKQETNPRAISKEHIIKIRDLKLKEGTTIFADRSFFMFCFYCKGINYHDLANLQWSNIENGRLRYTRAKTGGKLDMALLEPALEIVEYYRSRKKSDYIFPILTEQHKDPQSRYRRAKNGLKRHNKNLKKICEKLEIPPITSYVSRHSWANLMKTEHISTEIISESMDHKTVAQTATYLKKFDKSILDEANKAIL
jgi:integrase/recombinase XerD